MKEIILKILEQPYYHNCNFIKKFTKEQIKSIKNLTPFIEGDNNKTFKIRMYCIINNLNKIPKCKYCNNHVKWLSLDKGFRKFCTKTCSSKFNAPAIANIRKNKSVEEKEKILNKIKKTRLYKYGDPNFTNTSKRKQTNLEKYGTEIASKSQIIKDKNKKTCLEKYGVESYSQTKEYKDKIKQTNLEKYGTEYFYQTNEFKEKAKLTKLKLYGNENFNNRESYKNTCIEKYGVEHNFNILAENGNRVRENTLLEKYGVKSLFELKYIRKQGTEKSMETRSRLINELINSNRKFNPDYIKLAEENKIFWCLGLNETKILDEVEVKNGIILERQYPVCGYFVDGYDAENNVCYEVDENYHLNEEQIEKDKIRQQKIEDELNCTFVRILDIEN